MKAYEGRFNWRTPPGEPWPLYDPPSLYRLSREVTSVVTVDGKKISDCWYADTREGIAKAYVTIDATSDSIKISMFRVKDRPIPNAIGLSAPRGGEFELLNINEYLWIVSQTNIDEDLWIVSQTHRGKVEIWGDDE